MGSVYQIFSDFRMPVEYVMKLSRACFSNFAQFLDGKPNHSRVVISLSIHTLTTVIMYVWDFLGF